MPRFFFDIHDGGRFSLDDTGTSYETAQDACDEAMKVLPAIAKDEAPNGGETTFRVKVRDENGGYFFQASLEMKSGWLSPIESPPLENRNGHFGLAEPLEPVTWLLCDRRDDSLVVAER